MSYMHIVHTVEDYAKWRTVFDEDARTNHRANGITESRVFRNTNKPNEIIVMLKIDDLEKVRKYTESESLKEAMQRAGVIGHPTIYFIDEVS